jgi:hypothetical protein
MEMKKRYKLLLNSAKVRKIKVHLNTEYYADLIDMGCLYCGDNLKDKNGTCLDRQDSKQGYTNENVVGCCQICNYAKRTLTDQQFYDWVKRAYDHQLKCHTKALNHAVKFNYMHKKENKKQVNIYMNSRRMRNALVLKQDIDT